MSDLDGYCFLRTERGLTPADTHADEWLGTLAFKREVILTKRTPRSPQHHRWFFGLLKRVLENTEDRWSCIEELRDALKMQTGYFDIRQDMIGEYFRVPKSMNYASMSQEEFRLFVDRCRDAIATHTGLDPDELMAEVDAEQGWSPHQEGGT